MSPMTRTEANRIAAAPLDFSRQEMSDALIVLRDALRAAESQVAAMREAAAKVADEAAHMHGCSPCLCCEPQRRIAREIRALPLPAPVAPAPDYGTITGSGYPPRPPVARPLHPADCAHDSTPEVSVPHMPDPCGFVIDAEHVACPLPHGHRGWHRTPPVAPDPTTPAKPFDAEAALLAMEQSIARRQHGPTPASRYEVYTAIQDGIAAGRGAK